MKISGSALNAKLGDVGMKNAVLARPIGGGELMHLSQPALRVGWEIDLEAQWPAPDKALPQRSSICVILTDRNLATALEIDFSSYGAVAVAIEGHLDGDRAVELRRLTRRLFDMGFAPLVPIAASRARPDALLVYGRSDQIVRKEAVGGLAHSRVSMTSLGNNGRFANQLLQYAFLKLYSLRHTSELQLPDWIGRHIYDLRDSFCGDSDLPELRYFAFDDDDRFLWTLEDPPVDVDFWGYFQELPACWFPHRQLLRKLFSLNADLEHQVSAGLNAIRKRSRRPIVAIHVRRGDYKAFGAEMPWYRLVPIEWYADWLTKQLELVPDAIVYIASDALPEVQEELAQFQPVSFLNSGLPQQLSYLFDFEMLRRADTMTVVNSSFSRMAAIIAEPTQQAFIVNFDSGTFTPYEPWIDSNFWERFSIPGIGDPSLGSSPDASRRRALFNRIEIGKQRLALRRAGIGSED